MTRIIHAARNALLVTVALLTLGATPAQATSHQTFPGNWLYLTLTTGDAHFSSTRGTLLLCDPPLGHARAAEACAELATAGGDISRIPPRPDTICSMIYAPVTAFARGEWEGRQVTYSRTFSNACVMGAETGAVFALSG
ncbi:SSI family serine proteinase inhibitor [Streptomyces olivochromogenes]|uniref:SSI family serine proteinase inhibitor n=1 Tax=Streptomyces olivochromogenes TaxID=1963 RepID=UPI0036DE862E